jgi:hypothetical protein
VTRRATLVAFVAVVMAASPALGVDPLITDRPDFTESPNAVATGVVQFEAGATFAEFADASETTTLGEVLVRWGVLPRLEMRFVLPTYTWTDGRSGRSSGFVDSGVGLKYQFADGGGRGVLGGMEAGLIVSTTVPTGGAEFSSPAWQPVAVAAAGWDLGSSFGLGVNVGVGRPADDTDRYTTVWASAALGVGVTDDLSLFFELIGFNREEARGPNTATFQTGVVYLLSPDLQIDFRLGRRLTDHGTDLLLGAGVSWRLGG